jgi:hypothetical protein
VAMALTPLQLKSTFALHEQSPELQMELINQYRKVLGDLENQVKLVGGRKPQASWTESEHVKFSRNMINSQAGPADTSSCSACQDAEL